MGVMTKQWVPDGPRPSRVQRRDDNVFVMDPVHEGEGAVVMRRYFEAAFKWPVEIEMWDIPVGAWEGRHVHDEADPDGYVMADECYIVVAGRGRFQLGADEVDLEVGDAMFMDPHISRGVRNTGDEMLRIMVISDLPVQAMPSAP